MHNPTVTIIVTVYNIKPYLDRFFTCLNDQSYTDYVVLIIDDGSTDGSLELCRAYAEQDDRIHIHTLEHIGISAARNYAMEQIKTDLVTSLDGDDYFEKDYLKHLVDAGQKYEADLVISNVIYERDDGTESKRFVPRKEAFYQKTDFPEVIPELLLEARLNFLYGKLFRAAYLKDIRVEPDVMQGSDTMINIQYVTKIDSIAVIEDYDYHYIKYPVQRSVTSYKGSDSFNRLYRINRFVYDATKAAGQLDDNMIKAVDTRILYSAMIVFIFIAASSASKKDKLEQMKAITESPEYQWSYQRQKALGNLERLGISVIVPGTEKYYLRSLTDSKQADRLRKIREICPDFVFDLYHNAKIKLGLIPTDVD